MAKPPQSPRFNFPKAIAPVFKQPGATLILHGPDKFEIRFLPPAKDAVFARVAPVVVVFFFVLACAAAILSTGLDVGVLSLATMLFATLAGVALYAFLALFRRFIAPRMFARCHARGLVCNATLLNFTVWRRLYETPVPTTIPLVDVADVTIGRGNRLALATRDGRVLPFTREIANRGAAAALQHFIKNLATLDTSRPPRWQPADPPPPTDPKILFQQRHGSTPMRFSKRAKHKPDKRLNQRYFSPYQP
ncbi:MAG: hypothetical protein FWF96_00935 [Kiritimatiellaeota bacterium]|nr:hypothetical protein [Kiritimatiellota bacterium]